MAPTSNSQAALKQYENKKNAAYAALQPQEKKVKEFAALTNGKILDTLTPAQRTRWHQMLGKKFGP